MSDTVMISPAASSALPMTEPIGEDTISSDGSTAMETHITFHDTVDELEEDLSSRPSVARNQAKKAKRIKFLRNGDRFFKGVVMPVAAER